MARPLALTWMLLVFAALLTGCGGAPSLRAQPVNLRGPEYVMAFMDGQQRQAAKVFVRVSPTSGGFVHIIVQIPWRDELGGGYRLEEVTLEFESVSPLPLWLEPNGGSQSLEFQPYTNGVIHGARLSASLSEPLRQGTVDYELLLGPEYFNTYWNNQRLPPDRPLHFRASLVTRHGVAQGEFDLKLPLPESLRSESGPWVR